ncbi:MAG: hypothetical protein MRJ65_05975 [Candidatus Brocadiaceae bacterium]|nr:hypothetical protein [Candidatus Brocadiaceae bacterium]
MKGYIIHRDRNATQNVVKKAINKICDEAGLSFSEKVISYKFVELKEVLEKLAHQTDKSSEPRLYFIHNSDIPIVDFLEYFKEMKLSEKIPNIYFIFYCGAGISPPSDYDENQIKIYRNPFPPEQNSDKYLLLVNAVKKIQFNNFANIDINDDIVNSDSNSTQRTKIQEVSMAYNRAKRYANQIMYAMQQYNDNKVWLSIDEIKEKSDIEIIPKNEEPKKLRRILWHEFNNILKHATKNSGLNAHQLLETTAEWLSHWEKVYYGSIPEQLNKIKGKISNKKFEEASIDVDQFYANLLNTATFFDKTIHKNKIRKQFDILIVDDSLEYLSHTKRDFTRLADDCPEYSINILLVNPEDAYQDALKKLELIPSIQALVVDWDLQSRKFGWDNNVKMGDQLIEQFKREFPGRYACLLTGRGVLNVLRRCRELDVRPFDKHDPTAIEEIFRDILHSLKQRQKTPFFDALKEYSERPITVCHAMVISGCKTLKKSSWLTDFYDFYGERVFMAETSTTQPPLDSLFEPKGCIQEAQEKVAEVFGADKSFLVTNGTSTANKIVHQGLLKPGDTVLIDRNCHKSHHYGLVLVGTRPIYLQADPLSYDGEFTGICKGIRLKDILSSLEKNPNAKMLCITNCTFDGYIHDSRKIIIAVQKKLSELNMKHPKSSVTAPEDFIFFFDEAWFGFARFVNELRQYTGMFACHDIPNARVYTTQSTHKTLTAFRQGSMIHVRDPKFKLVEHSFKEALFTHFSTSPNYNIIASLDAGRMQADLEGPIMCQEAWWYAENLRKLLIEEEEKNGLFAEYFHLMTPEEMSTKIPVWQKSRLTGTETEFILDQTKLTLFLRKKSGLSGQDVRVTFLNRFNIQFNKITNNTVLLMVNMGSTESSLGHLITTLRAYVKSLEEEVPSQRTNFLPDKVFQRGVSFFNNNNAIREYYFRQIPEKGCIRTKLLPLEEIRKMLPSVSEDKPVVNANFVIPYPPGFPILVCGEIIDEHALEYLEKLKTNEIHGMPSKGILEIWDPADY